MDDARVEALIRLHAAVKELWYGAAECGCVVCRALAELEEMEEK